jgi:hypothetical protein
VENQCNVRIKCLRSDRGEYYFPSYCESVDSIHETPIAYTSQQNGVVERKNRTLVEMVNPRLLHMNYGRKENPILVILRCVGCRVIVRLPQPKIGNWD